MEPVVEEKDTLNESEIKPEKRENGFVRFLRAVFVHNFGYKLFAVLFGACVWVLTVAL